jgi:hypothetical protein
VPWRRFFYPPCSLLEQYFRVALLQQARSLCRECWASLVLGFGFVFVVVGMEAWDEDLVRYIEDLEDDEEDEFFLKMLEEGTMEYLGESSVRPKTGGSTLGQKFVFRDREIYHMSLYNDYFSHTPTYGPVKFRRRFRMRRELFLRIVDSVVQFDPWFAQRQDACDRFSFSSLQKCTAAIRMLAYGMAADACDEYCRLGASTAQECLRRFVIAVRGIFESTYLRQPTREDLERQMAINNNRGFPRMFASLDCMHWTWKNCPVAWQGQF